MGKVAEHTAKQRPNVYPDLDSHGLWPAMEGASLGRATLIGCPIADPPQVPPPVVFPPVVSPLEVSSLALSASA